MPAGEGSARGRGTLGRALGLCAAAALLALPAVVDRAVAEGRQRRAADEAARSSRAAADWARAALAVQLEGVALMTDNAVANPRVLAALRGRVDSRTFADLLANESWWEPYRDLRAAISFDGATLAFAQTEGDDGVDVAPIVREVGAGGRTVARLVAGKRAAFLVAASAAPLGPGRAAAVLLLARRVEESLLADVAARVGGPILLSDGRLPLGGYGADGGEVLAALVGQEARGDLPLADPAAHAAALEIGPGVWLWALGRGAGGGAARASADRTRWRLSWAAAIPLAAVIAARALRRRRKSIAAAPASTLVATTAPVPVLAPPALRPGPGTPLGRYLLVDQIGEGGMAEVFTAVSFGYGGFRKPFVIKRLRPELNVNPTAVGLFIDEANLASTLVHPNVVPVFDFGEAAGAYFLAQEYVVGRDLGRLNRRLRERGEPLLSTEIILYLAQQLLYGLQYAHDKRDDAGAPLGLVHRDITPENVIISERGEVKILDFGIVKARQRVSQTEHGTVRGNVGFMSPEQARGKNVDHRSDLFSAGLVILTAATGEPAYPGATLYDLLTAAAAGPLDAERARIAALPQPLPTILGRALEVDPDLRYQSAAEFGAAVAPFVGGTAQRELAARVLALFGDELRVERDRLAAAMPGAIPVAAVPAAHSAPATSL
jgi:serine/threonine-protein kinase